MQYFDVNDHEIQERLIAKNTLAFSFLTYTPIVPGHTLISPIRAVDSSDKLSNEEWMAILELKATVCSALKNAFGAEGFNFAWNMGEEAGQTVPHFHLHVVPRKTGDTGILQYEPRAFLYRPGSRAISPHEELKEVASLMRSQGVNAPA